jgi:hypothetical protein
MKTTSFAGLKQPEDGDYYSVSDFSGNMGTIDGLLEGLDTSVRAKADSQSTTVALAGKAGKPVSFTVTLAAGSWSSDKKQTVSNSKFVTTGYSYQVAADPGSYEAYTAAQIYAQNVTSTGKMTFAALGDAPSVDLTVNILREEVSNG